MQPKEPGIKPRKIHQLFLGITSFHFQIIRLRSAGTSKRWPHLNSSTDPKSQHSGNLEGRPTVSNITPAQSSHLRVLKHPIIIRTSSLKFAALTQEPAFLFTDLFCCGDAHIAGRLQFNTTLEAKSKDMTVCRCNSLPIPICTKSIHVGQTCWYPSNSRA